jgi:hypothetical protein
MNHKIFLVCENVDLGYHVIHAYTDEQLALDRLEMLNTTARQKKIHGLMTGCGYTQERAEEYVGACEFYCIDTTVLTLSPEAFSE